MSYCKPFKRGVSWRSQNFGDNATIYGPHSGNDDAAPIGTPVHAAGDGYIDWAGEFDDTYQDNLLWLLKMGGNILVLNCGANEPSFVYGHLNSFTVKRGDWVRKGQVIAYSGNTGTATTGAHLHTEAIPPGYALNSPMLGRVSPDIYLTEWPEDIDTGSLSFAGTTTTPISTSAAPKEWDEMASAEEIRAIVRAESDASNIAMAKQGDMGRALGWFIMQETPLQGWNGGVSAAARIAGTDQAVNDIRAQLGALHGQVAGLVGALAAVVGGEPFDEAKLLAGVQSAAEAGVKEAIESITVTVKESK